jgi:hypothetical protein
MPKGIKQVLLERGLWPANNWRTAANRHVFLQRCPRNHGLLRSISSIDAERLLEAKWKVRLKEQYVVIFYPKFHCELIKFIEHLANLCQVVIIMTSILSASFKKPQQPPASSNPASSYLSLESIFLHFFCM